MTPNLTIHHLRRSQSERIIWLCEELSIPYTLKTHLRQPTLEAPDSYRDLHWTGTAPIIEDGPDIKLAETNAIFEYILTKYGNGRLVLPPTHPRYADYVFWLHRANGTMQPSFVAVMFSRFNKKKQSGKNDEGAAADGADGNDPIQRFTQKRIDRNFAAMEEQLGKYPFLAGEEFTAADCVSVFSLTTLRLFVPYGIEKFPNIVRYLERIGQREGYRRAMEKGDPDMEPILSAAAPAKSLL